jgi:hypothetical protein
MPSKRHEPEEIVAKLRQVDVVTSQGQTVADAVRSIGVSEVTYHRWRQECGGLKTNQVRRMKDPELENQRLRKVVADLSLDKLILAEAGRGNFQAPRGPRACVEHIKLKLDISERRACRVLGQHRSTRAARCRGAETTRRALRLTSSRLRVSLGATAVARSPPWLA